MIPRPAGCDGPDCTPSASGWVHDPECATTAGHNPFGDDMAWSTAMEDGYARRPIPAQRRNAA